MCYPCPWTILLPFSPDRTGSTCTGDMLGAKTRARNARMGLSPFAVARREPCLGDQSRRVPSPFMPRAARGRYRDARALLLDAAARAVESISLHRLKCRDEILGRDDGVSKRQVDSLGADRGIGWAASPRRSVRRADHRGQRPKRISSMTGSEMSSVRCREKDT